MPKLSLHRNLVSRFNIGPLFVTRNIIVQSMFIFKNSPPREPSSPPGPEIRVARCCWCVGGGGAVTAESGSQSVFTSDPCSHLFLAPTSMQPSGCASRPRPPRPPCCLQSNSLRVMHKINSQGCFIVHALARPLRPLHLVGLKPDIYFLVSTASILTEKSNRSNQNLSL